MINIVLTSYSTGASHHCHSAIVVLAPLCPFVIVLLVRVAASQLVVVIVIVHWSSGFLVVQLCVTVIYTFLPVDNISLVAKRGCRLVLQRRFAR